MSLSGDIAAMSPYDDVMGPRRTISNWAFLGPAVRDARLRAGLTQAALADEAGVSRGWLIRFEAGLPNAEPVTVLRLLRSLGLVLSLSPLSATEGVLDDADHPPVDLDTLLSELDGSVGEDGR
ncbi:helix-turn-helix domain-containing protein [Nocardioides nitrophenolicus]|uniref:helix-turn-helix domain-containing protein n=1 Tax=Nocardioides nitrophenolicus TaxID=60489 RepID=UPI001959CA6C|nr:helix-turn-helix domain-containing protein [Nocardioides nitrophenolicus]MBM7516574.1 transcriptional regulator with XRE-family HTH domain [Nocardioides nitrophenolicus]